jgi:hypothetical protein
MVAKYNDLPYNVETFNLFADNVIMFRNLVSEIDISKYEQTEYVSVVNSIYYHIFIDQEEE